MRVAYLILQWQRNWKQSDVVCDQNDPDMDRARTVSRGSFGARAAGHYVVHLDTAIPASNKLHFSPSALRHSVCLDLIQPAAAFSVLSSGTIDAMNSPRRSLSREYDTL